MTISAIVDIIGYTITSVSNPFLKEANAISIVNREFANPKNMVANTTTKISKNCAKVKPQIKLPKITDNKLMARLVSRVITVTDLKSV